MPKTYRRNLSQNLHRPHEGACGRRKKSGVWLSKWAAKVFAGLGQQLISAETPGQHAEQADAGLLLHKLLDDAEGTKASAGCSAASVSSSESVQEGTCQDKPQTQDVTDMLSELHERVLELERELVFFKVKRCMNPMLSDDDE